MQNKQLTISSSNITRCFLLFIVLLTIGIGLYGYNYTNAWLAEKVRAEQHCRFAAKAHRYLPLYDLSGL